MSFRLIHSEKYGGDFIQESLHCWGTFVFKSQFPLKDASKKGGNLNAKNFTGNKTQKLRDQS